MPPVETLIIVACHGVYLGGPTKGVDKSEWLIEAFQAGETPTYIEHIRRGVEELAASEGTALLAFSGGATKRLKTRGSVTKTEADGYINIALQHDLFGLDTSDGQVSRKLQHHIFAERFAADSYQNILLPLILFPLWRRQHLKLVAGNIEEPPAKPAPITRDDITLPQRLVIVSHEFKRARFMDLHVPAIRSVWPVDKSGEMQVDFIGINPPFSESELHEVEEGERKRGYRLWKDDLFGTGEVLCRKRVERSWDEDEFLTSLVGGFDEGAIGVVKNLIRGVNGGVDQVSGQ